MPIIRIGTCSCAKESGKLKGAVRCTAATHILVALDVSFVAVSSTNCMQSLERGRSFQDDARLFQ